MSRFYNIDDMFKPKLTERQKSFEDLKYYIDYLLNFDRIPQNYFYEPYTARKYGLIGLTFYLSN